MRFGILAVRPSNAEIFGDIVAAERLENGQPPALIAVLIGKVSIVAVTFSVIRSGLQCPRTAEVKVPAQL